MILGRSKETILLLDNACRLCVSSIILRISKWNLAASCSRMVRTSSRIGSGVINNPPLILLACILQDIKIRLVRRFFALSLISLHWQYAYNSMSKGILYHELLQLQCVLHPGPLFLE